MSHVLFAICLRCYIALDNGHVHYVRSVASPGYCFGDHNCGQSKNYPVSQLHKLECCT